MRYCEAINFIIFGALDEIESEKGLLKAFPEHVKNEECECLDRWASRKMARMPNAYQNSRKVVQWHMAEVQDF